MYDYLTGRLAERGPDDVVVDIGGVGYRLAISGATASRLPQAGDVTLYVHDMLRDDRLVLYGFASPEERALFLRLLGVSRIGPGLALSLLSALEPAALAGAVERGDSAALARVRGVGKRTAERLCVELKGRLTGFGSLPGAVTDQRAAVCSALMALGYPRATATLAAERATVTSRGEVPLEELVKQALAALSAAPATAGPRG